MSECTDCLGTGNQPVIKGKRKNTVFISCKKCHGTGQEK